MQTREIPSEQWQPFFSDFTWMHQGKHVNVETLGQGIGVRSEICDQPLVGIAAGPDGGRREWIEVIAGAGEAPEGGPRTHSIRQPAAVRCAEEENGRTVAVQIDSSDGSVTMIRFQPPPENLPAGFKLS